MSTINAYSGFSGTFIETGQEKRERSVRRKLNVMEEQFAGKNVLLVDDSIVRGTTSREIVLMAREAGARRVFFASCAPPITNAHIYGESILEVFSSLIRLCGSHSIFFGKNTRPTYFQSGRINGRVMLRFIN